MKTTLTPKEERVYEELRRFFLRGGESCIACMVQKYWKVYYGEEDYSYYEQRQRKLVGALAASFRKENTKLLERYTAVHNGKSVNKKLWLMTVTPCPEHGKLRVYKILNSPVDHEIVSNLAANRIEGLVTSQVDRVEGAVKRWPRVFKNRVKYIRSAVPFLPAGRELK